MSDKQCVWRANMEYYEPVWWHTDCGQQKSKPDDNVCPKCGKEIKEVSMASENRQEDIDAMHDLAQLHDYEHVMDTVEPTNPTQENQEVQCWVCKKWYDPNQEMFRKYHKGNICGTCSRELYEEDIGYDPNK